MTTSVSERLEPCITDALTGFDLDRAEELARRYVDEAGPLRETDVAHSPWFRSRYLYVLTAWTAGRLAEMSERAMELRDVVARLPDALACQIWLLMAEAHARQSQHDEANAALRRADQYSAIMASDISLLVSKLRIRLWLGDLALIGQELSDAYRIVHGDPHEHAMLLCDEGRAWDAVDDMDRAEACWRRAAAISRHLSRDTAHVDALLQLGRMEHLRGHLQEALDRFDEAAARAHSGSPQHCEARLRRLWVELEVNEWPSATARFEHILGGRNADELPEELRELAALIRAVLTSNESESERLDVRAYQRAANGDHRMAITLYERAWTQAKDSDRRARLALAVGLLMLSPPNADAARVWLTRAEEMARERDLPEVLWRALEAKGRAAQFLGDDVLARQCYEQAILCSESQRRQLRNAKQAASYDLHRTSVTRHLLRGAFERGDAAGVFRFQELDRGRFLLELSQTTALCSPTRHDEDAEVNQIARRLAAIRQQLQQTPVAQATELLLAQDRLSEQLLAHSGRRDDVALPLLPALDDLRRILPRDSVYIATNVIESDVQMLAVRGDGQPQLTTLVGAARQLLKQLAGLRASIDGQLQAYARGQSLDHRHKGELDGQLAQIGDGPFGAALERLLVDSRATRVFWAPEDELHGLPLAAVRRRGRYLIQDFEVANTFGAAWLAHQARRRALRRRGPALIIAESPDILRFAELEAAGIASCYLFSRKLQPSDAHLASIRRLLTGAKLVHVACHAYFEPSHPLRAFVRLPSGEDWLAVQWLHEPLQDLRLLTLSACRSAEVSGLIGREVFGLGAAALAAGVRNVVAGLWPVPDRETARLMWKFYRRLLTADPTAALAETQREILREHDSTPLTWAVFASFGGISWPRQMWWARLWGSIWQRIHKQRYP